MQIYDGRNKRDNCLEEMSAKENYERLEDIWNPSSVSEMRNEKSKLGELKSLDSFVTLVSIVEAIKNKSNPDWKVVPCHKWAV